MLRQIINVERENVPLGSVVKENVLQESVVENKIFFYTSNYSKS
jgi:hypothetical protein